MTLATLIHIPRSVACLLLLLASASAPAWALEGKAESVAKLRAHGHRMLLADDNTAVVCFAQPAGVEIVDLTTGKSKSITFPDEKSFRQVGALAVSSDGKRAAYSAYPNSVHLIDVASATTTSRLDVALRGGGSIDLPTAMALENSGRLWCWSDGSGIIRTHAAKGIGARITLDKDAYVYSLAVTANGARAFALARVGKPPAGNVVLYVIDGKNSALLRTHVLAPAASAYAGMYDTLTLSQDDRTIAVQHVAPDEDSVVRVYEANELGQLEPKGRLLPLPANYHSKVGLALNHDGSSAAVLRRGAAAVHKVVTNKFADGWYEAYSQPQVAQGALMIFDLQKMAATGIFNEQQKTKDIAGVLMTMGKGFPSPQGAAFNSKGELYVLSLSQIYRVK